jgi:hypothetical protein
MPFIDTIPEGHESLAAKWAVFGGFVDVIAERLAEQAQGFEVVVAAMDGQPIGRVVLGDFRTKFAAITWRLTTVDPGNGGVGAVTSFYKPASSTKPSKWNRGDAAFMTDGFRRYAELDDDEGLFYLALHETAHVSRLGLLVQDACWRKYLSGGGAPTAAAYANTPCMIYNEQVANEIVRVVAAQVGLDVLSNPTHGSPPTPMSIGLQPT